MRTHVASEKLALGIPLYARDTRTADWRSYRDIMTSREAWAANDGQGLTANDDEMGAWYWNSPVLVRDGSGSPRRPLPGPPTPVLAPRASRASRAPNPTSAQVAQKVRYAAQMEAGGVMLWELGQDLPPSDDRALLRAVRREDASPLCPAHAAIPRSRR